MHFFRTITEALAVFRQAPLEVDLMLRAAAANDPFYSKLVREFHADATAPHRKMPWAGRFDFGVALCRLPAGGASYLDMVEPSAARNFRKARRAGYVFARIDFNRRLDEIAAILRSTDVRQGRLPEELARGVVRPCQDPPSTTDVHDYAYFGVLDREGALAAYAGCFVSGEALMIEQLYGHAACQADGVVPMLLVEIAAYARQKYPRTRYFIYGSYFGAGASLRRFKRKFGFFPCRVRWLLDGGGDARDRQLVFRQRRAGLFEDGPPSGSGFVLVASFAGAVGRFRLLKRTMGCGGWFKLVLKVLAGRRAFYCLSQDGEPVSYGWLALGFCRHYRVDSGSVVIGPVWTKPEARGRGYATSGLKNAIDAMYRRGHGEFYIDTADSNTAMKAVIAKCGFGEPVSSHLRGLSIR